MAVWIISALKAVLPHAGTIIEAARPILTKRRGGDFGPGATASQEPIADQQIAELQAAVSQNDVHIRELAQQLQRTVTAIQDAAVLAEEKSRSVTRMAVGAMAVALVATVLSLVAIALSN